VFAAFFITALFNLSHFGIMLLFALLVSMALACLTQQTASNRIKYALWSFALFVVISVSVAWLMYPISR
jgi:predicted membrane channel-forming protein YqfA (hemolysin III family)